MKKKEISLKIGKILNNVAEKIVLTDSITIEAGAKRVKEQVKKGATLEDYLLIVTYAIIYDILEKVIEDEKERNSSGTERENLSIN